MSENITAPVIPYRLTINIRLLSYSLFLQFIHHRNHERYPKNKREETTY